VKANTGTRSIRKSSATDKTLRRLTGAPETACRIFEFAESLYWRDETAERMSSADIEQVNQFLQQTENDLKWMKKQFQDLAEIEDGFQSEVIPIGF
jgi:hypothetical protein